MKTLYYFITILFIIGCSNKIKPSVEDIKQADRRFSQYSRENGFAKAFVEFAHPDAVILRKNSMPVAGLQAIEQLYEKAKNSPVQLTWEPLNGELGSGSDLGYTYGIYTAVAGSDTTQGTYVTVWKKDAAENWKYILDTGNEGLRP